MKIDLKKDVLTGLARRVIEAYFKLQESLALPKSVGDLGQTALVELQTKEAQFRASWSLLVETLQPALADANRQAELTINAAKKVLRLKVSERWSPVWGEAGFPNGSTQTPATMELREVLLVNLGEFLKSRPEWQNEELDVTAAILSERAAALRSARAAIDAHAAAHKQVVKERKTLAARLRSRLASLIKELKHVLAPDDSRWAAFGLESPAAERANRSSRAEKAQAKAEIAAAKKAEADRRKIEVAQEKSLKASHKADRIQAAADAAKVAAEKAAADVFGIEANVRARSTTVVSPRAVRPSTATPTVPSEAAELGDSALNA